MNKLKVLHVYRTYYPDTQGGLEETIRQICLNTQSRGVESKVLTLSSDPSPKVIEREEATVIRVRKHMELASCSISFAALKAFEQACDWADVVHYHFPWPFADTLHLLKQPKKPTVLTYHSDVVRQKWLNFFYAPLQNWFLSSVTRVVCTSPNYFATSPILSKVEDKVEVIPIGLDERKSDIVTDGALEKVREQYGTDFFLFVGVLRYYKGLHILLDAIRGASYRVVIVGSGPIEGELIKQAEKSGLDNVVFTGYVSDEVKHALFELSRGIVFPSYLRSEAFGVTLLEGAMHSRPLISTEVGSGTSHVNVDGETGLVVPPGSVKALRQAMDQLVFRPDMAELMGRRARKRFEKLFTGDLMGARYADLYRQLTGDSDAAPVTEQVQQQAEVT